MGEPVKGAMRFRWTEGFELIENLILSLMRVPVERPSLALELLPNNFLPPLWGRNGTDWGTDSSFK